MKHPVLASLTGIFRSHVLLQDEACRNVFEFAGDILADTIHLDLTAAAYPKLRVNVEIDALALDSVRDRVRLTAFRLVIRLFVFDLLLEPARRFFDELTKKVEGLLAR